MSARCLVLGLVLCTSAAFGQARLNQMPYNGTTPVLLQRDRSDQSSQLLPHARLAGQDTISVLAIMVDFQTDADNQTTGTGRFLLADSVSQAMIDPPPHDSAYFAYKLLFLSNYYRKVSGGKVNIKGEVLGRVVTLSKPMSSYSPAKDGTNDRPLADLVVESWRKADSLNPSLPFARYQAFVIFHAGVGRDIDLVARYGYDPSPFDIPSLTFNIGSFRKYLGDQTFAGIPVSKGAYRITNTLLLPETESRIVSSGLQPDTLQGSINGLLANSFGSYLGLPDLFDTKTGSSGIGDFGLMDVAQSIAFYGGLFPPEPSAWEKIYLGWVTPITLPPGTTTLSVPAVGLKTGRDTVYKIPITDREYFLLENRSRDPHQNGQRLTIRKKNSIITRVFPTDSIGFNYADVGSISGSVIDVEDFDWALPGFAIQSDTLRGGGILIWHIDEESIERGLPTNTVNADPNHRGVSLEEADGSPDIGRSYSPFSDAGAGTELGWPLDFWFDGNTVLYLSGSDTVNFYRNIFDNNSHPDSKSYSGAPSLVSVRGFSKRSPRMTATVQIGDTQAKRIQAFARRYDAKIAATAPTVLPSGVLVGIDGAMYAFKPDGSSRTNDMTGLLYPKGGSLALGAAELGSSLVVAGIQDSTLHIVNAYARSAGASFDSVRAFAIPIGERITTPAMFADLSIIPQIVVGTDRGTILSYSYTGTLVKKTAVSTSAVTSLTQIPWPALSKPVLMYYVSGGRLYSEQASIALGDSSFPWTVVGTTGRTGDLVAVAQMGGRKILGFNRDLTQALFEFTLTGGRISELLTADVDGDGEKDVVAVAEQSIVALNRTGAVLPGFPLVAPSAKSFSGNVLFGDVTGDSRGDLVTVLSSGEIIAFDRMGRAVDGFPLQYASAGRTNVALFPTSSGNLGIVGVTASGAMQGVEIPKLYNAQNIVWSQYLRDARHSNGDPLMSTASPVPTEYLPSGRVYNWPNPVRGSTTQIRYYTPEDAAITIKIFDLAGMKVAELTARSKAGVDGEVTWDVSNIQSGVYLARLEATGAGGSHTAIIKIAVVK